MIDAQELEMNHYLLMSRRLLAERIDLSVQTVPFGQFLVEQPSLLGMLAVGRDWR
jgi:hypothetical protein